MKKFSNVLISREKVRNLLENGVDKTIIKILEHMIENHTTVRMSLRENGIVGMKALEMTEDLIDMGLIHESALDEFVEENEMIDRAMAQAIEEKGDSDLVDPGEIFALLDKT